MKKVLPLFFLAVLMLSACQPTPEEDIVVNKGDSSYIAATATGADPFSEVPSKYDLSFSSDDQSVVVNIDASVKVPDIDRIPLAALTPRMFTQDEVDKIIGALMQNQPLYEPRGPEDYSKDELMEIILQLESGANSDLYLVDPDAYYKEIEDELEMYKQLYETAPDEAVYTPASTELQTRTKNDITTTYVNVTADLGKEDLAYFIYTDRATQNDTFMFCNTPGIPPGDGLATGDLDIENVKMSVEEAQEIAEETVNQMGFSGFTVNGIASIPNLGNSTDDTDIPKCYMFYFTRSVNGLSETYAHRAYYGLAAVEAGQESAQYNFVWPVELLEIAVDDTGILTIYYTGPTADAEIVNDNIEIMDFEDIIQRFKDQVLVSYPKEAEVIKTTVNIDRIVFGGTKIINQNGNGDYLLVPTWDFFGSVVYQYKAGTGDQAQLNGNNEFTWQDYGFSIMTINAANGSIINRSIGY